MIWLSASWDFVRKYASFFGMGLLAVAGFFVGVSVKKRPTLIAGQDEDKTKAEADTKKAEEALDQKAAEVKRTIEEHYASDLQAVVEEQEKKEPSLENDPDSTNEYLKDVGGQARGGGHG